jgi:site-specific DNA recombinase
MRAALYARYSSDLQDARSIAGQHALARALCEARGWSVERVFEDAAISGATSIARRPGLSALMADAEKRAFDVVVTESLDRLSRDQETIAGIYKRLRYVSVGIFTLVDGEVSEIHVGLKGTMSALFLAELAQKTRRGHHERLKAGRVPGGRLYGYDVVKDADDKGQRSINEIEAAIVRRIFIEFAGGASARHIATRLNREGIKSPKGGPWNASTIAGNKARASGLLHNEMYRGVIVYNRQRFQRHPETGRRVSVINPPEKWARKEVPHLRVIDEVLWDAVSRARRVYASRPMGEARRPKRLLSGLLHCSRCGGVYTIRGRDLAACSNRTNKGTCENARSVPMREIEVRVLKALEQHLLAPDMVEAAIEAFRAERQALARDRVKIRAARERRLADVEAKLQRYFRVIEAGGDPAALAAQLNALHAEKLAAEAELVDAPPADVIALHPNAAQCYREQVAAIHKASETGQPFAAEARFIIRSLIDRIVVQPRATDAPVQLTVHGDLAALMQRDDQQGVSVFMIPTSPMKH